MSTTEETKPPITDADREKVVSNTSTIINNAISAGRMLHMMAKGSGLSDIEIALGMQVATIYILGNNPKLAAVYQLLVKPLLTVAKVMGVQGFKPTQPDPSMPVPPIEMTDTDFSIEKVHVLGARFKMGHATLSDGVRTMMKLERVMECLTRYADKDWGSQLSSEEKEKNNRAAEKDTGTLFAVYLIDDKKPPEPGNMLYIITQPDRQETKVLLALEY